MATAFRDLIAASRETLQSLAVLEPQMDRAIHLTTQCLASGHKILACGNGGSAADASHLVTEFVVRYLMDRRPYGAIALTESGSTLTAAGNDYGFDQVFARQVWALGQMGDVLVVFSTSGQSSNIVRALEQSGSSGIQSIAFLGQDGGAAKGLATVEIIVPSDCTARIQEAHILLIHALCESVEQKLMGYSSSD